VKKNRVIIPLVFLIVLGVCGIGYGVIRNDNNVKKLTVSAEQQTMKNSDEDIRISNLNFYQNLHEQRDTSALVIGDSIGESTGASNANKQWFNQIAKDVKTKYNSNMTTDLMTGGSSTSIRGWVELGNTKITQKYDVAFICFGQNDQGIVTPQQFKMFYESMIINLKKANPNIEIIPIMESSLKQYNEYSSVIVGLSKHYNLQYADTIQAFNNSGKLYSDLTKDGTHPNDKGYSYYISTIEKIISDNYKANKKTKVTDSVLYSDTNKLKNFTFNNTPNSSNGFDLSNGIIGNKVGNSVTFNTTNSVVVIHFMRQPNGGKFKVFIDDKFIKEIDTNLAFSVSYSDLISDNLAGSHKIKIEISTINKRGSVNILGLATN